MIQREYDETLGWGDVDASLRYLFVGGTISTPPPPNLGSHWYRPVGDPIQVETAAELAALYGPGETSP